MDDPNQQAEDSRTSSYKPNKSMAFTALAGVVLVGVLVIAFLASLSSDTAGERYPKVFFLIAASVLGSLVNQPFRDKEDNKGKGPTLFVLYLAWKCAVASVFAILINLVFISGVISGELFPRFSGTGLAYHDMMDWAVSVDPITNADMAKMLVWSFLAGFSEKLVPNMVTMIFVAPE